MLCGDSTLLDRQNSGDPTNSVLKLVIECHWISDRGPAESSCRRPQPGEAFSHREGWPRVPYEMALEWGIRV